MPRVVQYAQRNECPGKEACKHYRERKGGGACLRLTKKADVERVSGDKVLVDGRWRLMCPTAVCEGVCNWPTDKVGGQAEPTA